MTILVTGATGRVGRQVVQQLVARDAAVRVLVRDPAKADFPAGVEVVQGDLLDIDSLRAAFTGVRTLFLLNAVAADEFTQALITLNIARESGVERVVYLSVIHVQGGAEGAHGARPAVQQLQDDQVLGEGQAQGLQDRLVQAHHAVRRAVEREGELGRRATCHVRFLAHNCLAL